MKKIFSSFFQDSHYRYKVTSALSFLLILLLPVIGWNPLLILWMINLFLSAKVSASKRMRTFYIILSIIPCIFIIFNLLTYLFLL